MENETNGKTYDFDEEHKHSMKYRILFDSFYKSAKFKEKIIDNLFLKDMQLITILGCEHNQEIQLKTGIDTILKLSNGINLFIDEKIRKPEQIQYPDTYPVETTSVSIAGSASKAGWGYNIGRYICHAQLNKECNKFEWEPIIYFISRDFVSQVTRNIEYKNITTHSKQQGKEWYSIFKIVPKEVLIKF